MMTGDISYSLLLHICRDEDCPECGWPETYYEVAEDTPGALAIGCSKCGWRQANAVRER
jgi:hypothetical protein